MPRRRLSAIIACALSVGCLGVPSAHAYDPDSRPSAPPPGAAIQAEEGQDRGQEPQGLGAALQGLSSAAAAAAKEESPDKPTAKEAVVVLEPGLKRDALLTELSTAGYYELAATARSLGLGAEGSEEELRARLYAYYGLEAPAPPSSKGGKVVTIERASEASFAKVEEEEGGIVKASGGVILSLSETNGDVHRIRADSIVYNRARSTLTARGSVYYERSSGGSVEVFKGEALSADLDDWSGVFLDGKVRKAGSGTAASSDDRGLVVEADTILRRSADVMVLENGIITSCDEADPHYSVKAKHVWLLGDKEFAVTNAVFALGNVPILWLPFFFYPGDEMVYHPVFGYRSREGRFMQTTTYIVGSKPASEDSSSMFSFKTGSDKPTKLKGLFLRRVSGEKPKETGTLKAILDFYSSLGAVTGVSGSFDKLGPLGKTELYAAVAESRSIFPVDSTTGSYSPFVEAGGWKSVWNSSDFLGYDLPFRYGANFSTSFAAGGLTTSLALPLYSDPYFEQDFSNRSEDMDWFSVFKSEEDTTTTTVSTRSQLLPSISTSFSYKPKFLSPWISTISLSKLTTYASFLTKSTTAAILDESATLFNVDPRRTFFYPATFRPIEAALTFSGSLFNSSSKAKAASEDAKKQEGGEATKERLELKSPWLEDKAKVPDGAEAAASEATAEAPEATAETTDATAAAPDAAAAAPEAAAEDKAALGFRLPARAQSPSAARDRSWSGSVGWSFSPSGYFEDRYLSDTLVDSSDIDYSLLYDLISYKLSGGLDALSSYSDFFDASLNVNYTDQSQSRPYIYDDGTTASATTIANYLTADRLYENRSVTETSKMTLKPFAGSWLWSGSSLAWDMSSTVYGYKYNSTKSVFEETWVDWNPDTITSHNLTATLAARPGGLTQSLTFIAALPPSLDSYTAKLGLDAGVASFRLQGRMFKADKDAVDYSYDPITAGITIGASPWPVLTDTFVYDAFEDEEPDSNILSLSWGFFSSSLTAKQSYDYRPVVGTGWVSYGAESFQFTDLAASLAPTIKGDLSAKGGPVWSVVPSLSLAQSLIKYSESSLSFSLSASFKVSNTLSLTLSSSSANSAPWHYYAGLFQTQIEESGKTVAKVQTNPIDELLASLTFWDDSVLRSEAARFKLKSLSLKAEQDLHDWTLSVEAATAPKYDSTAKTYSLDTTFTILLKWKDLSDIKTKLVKTSKDSANDEYTLTY
jgi:lipopolysaccharide assembly outer membrane protein LptD (OstA)